MATNVGDIGASKTDVVDQQPAAPTPAPAPTTVSEDDLDDLDDVVPDPDEDDLDDLDGKYLTSYLQLSLN